MIRKAGCRNAVLADFESKISSSIENQYCGGFAEGLPEKPDCFFAIGLCISVDGDA